MFYHLSGIVAETEPNLAVIDCGGVGYAVNMTHNTLAKLSVGDKAKLYISEIIRDEVFDLYGFADKNERRCFELLLSVSGLGPKAALSILSSTTPQQLSMAVVMGDEKALTAAPGIGKKIAQRIILELKDKLIKEQGGFEAGSGAAAAMPAQNNKAGEATAALAVLGYGSQEIGLALKGIDMDALPLEEIIRQSLKKMVK